MASQWIETYSWILKNKCISRKKNVYLISYENLCSKKESLLKLFKLTNSAPEKNLRKLKSSNKKSDYSIVPKNIDLVKEAQFIYKRLLDKSFI